MPGGGVPAVQALRPRHGHHLPAARGGELALVDTDHVTTVLTPYWPGPGLLLHVGRLRHGPRHAVPGLRQGGAAVGLLLTRGRVSCPSIHL